MRPIASTSITDDRRIRLGLAAKNIGSKVNRLYAWLNDRTRQLRSIQGNEALLKALLSAEKAPVEGARLSAGEHVNIYQPDGSRIRLRACGVRSGGFSNVYTVVDLDEMKPYCLKESRALPGDEARKNRDLADEAEISLRLAPHGHLVTTHGAFYFRSRLFVLTEYLPNENLDFVLRRSPIGVAEAIGYGIQICCAMRHAQTVLPGFIHGDIKPSNCLLSSDGTLKLGDFGLSSASGIGRESQPASAPRTANDPKSASRGWGGTTSYMAPEMFHPHEPDRKTADMYALGVTLFEMVSGVRPFAHSSKSELIEMHRSMPPRLELLADKNAPESMIGLVGRCLAKNPAERPADFFAVEEELTGIGRENFGAAILPRAPAEPEERDSAVTALSFLALGKADRAIGLINETLSRDGRSGELLAVKAVILSAAGRDEDAYEASTSALMVRSDLPEILTAHARVLFGKGNLQSAREYLQRAIDLDPENCATRNLLARVCSRTGDHEEAAEQVRRSLRIDDAQPEAYEILARIDLSNKLNSRAVGHARKALTIDPDRASAHEIAAQAFQGKGQLIEAIKAYKAALRKGAPARNTRHGFARVCILNQESIGRTTDLSLARSLLKSARILAEPVANRGEADSFIRSLFNSPVSRGTDASVLFYHDFTLAKIFDDAGARDAERLVETLRELYAAGRSRLPSHLLCSVGRIFYHLDETDDCESVFAEMLERFGPNESSYYFLAACAEIRGDLGTSLDYYEKANKMLDSEDSRTGIKRVKARRRKAAEIRRRNRLEPSSLSPTLAR